MNNLSFLVFLASLLICVWVVSPSIEAKTLPNAKSPLLGHILTKREAYYNNGYYNNYPNNNYHHNHHNRPPCGPFRRRACHPGLRAATVIGTAAFGGALIGSGLRGRK